ncbi:MAG TPA: hypothetical protein VK324_13585 [Tepidisphaeraceae bacterium]|nr:hypothetical protein [Tepidisphaeraceae bacterium]
MKTLIRLMLVGIFAVSATALVGCEGEAEIGDGGAKVDIDRN